MIELKITANSVEEYRALLLGICAEARMAEAPTPAPAAAKPAKATAVKPAKTAAVKPAEPKSAPVEAAAPAETKTPTIDQLQAVGRKIALSGKVEQLKAVLDKYGAQKLPEIPEERRAEALADLEAANGTD